MPEIELTQQLFVSQVTLDLNQLNTRFGSGVRFRAMVNRAAHDAVIRLETYLLRRTVGTVRHEVTFECPASWWQALKAEHAPAWIRRRWPVRMRTEVRTVNVELYDVFPESKMIVPELGAPIRLCRIEGE